MITTQDKELLAKKGITEAQIAEQLACFQTGFPFLKLDAAASIEKGILAPDAEEQKAYLAAWDAYKNTDKTIVKFVPASGAASRMFKNLFEFLSAEYDKPTTKFEQAFFDGIRNFAFYDDLNVACQRTAGKDIPGLLEEGNYKAVVAALLETAGLNYGALPKGLLKFHKYPEGPRTPLEEHLAEGAMYAAGKSGKVNVHFTVSTEHRELFKKLVEEKTGEFAKRYGVDYYITFSEQKPSTDTIAADMDNQPFRDNGKLLFRPGGHGALIENLNDLDADIIFIKNIDNVVPDKLKADTVTYKKLIAGVLVANIQNIKTFKADENTDASTIPIPIYDVYYALLNNSVIDIDHFTAADASETEQKIAAALERKQEEIFRKVLDEAGLDPKETFFIDDSEANCITARSLGISTYTPKAGEDWSHLFK